MEAFAAETFCLRKAEDGTFAGVSVIALPDTLAGNSDSPVSVRFRPGTLSGRDAKEQQPVLNADGTPYLDKDGHRSSTYKELASITGERITLYNGQSGLYRFVPAKGSNFTLKLTSLKSDEIVAEYALDLK